MKKILASLTILSILFFFTPNQAYAVATTWNSADKSTAIDLTNGDLTATQNTTSWHAVRGTVGKSTGKWYWEITVNDVTGNQTNGILLSTNSVDPAGNFSSVTVDTVYTYDEHGEKSNGGGNNPAFGSAYVATDVIGVAVDYDANKIWFAVNNTWQASGDPAGGTNEAYAVGAGTFMPFFGADASGAAVTANFSSTPTYTPPSGFSTFDSPASAPSRFGDITLFGDW